MSNKAATLLILIFVIGLADAGSQRRVAPRRDGKDWLSFTAQTRSYLVEVYLDGYLDGKTDACAAAGDLFEQGPVHDPKDSADQRCFRKAKSYSRDVDDYIGVLTAFYTKYPQFRNIPDLYLIQTLTDDRYTTADGIYQMAVKGEIRTNF
jgi:hypothetical protein